MGLTPSSTGELLGKRLGCSSYISSDCSSEKKVRSKSPQGESLTPGKEAVIERGGSNEFLRPEGFARPWVETKRGGLDEDALTMCSFQ